GERRDRRLRQRPAGRAGEQSLRALLHDQARRHGHGAAHLPLDRRAARRPAGCRTESRWRHPDALHRAGGPSMTASRVPLVYVVDDDDALRDALRFLLESAGYAAETYAAAEQFLALPRFQPGSCIILDVRMPGMSGIELQRELARRGSILPIIFLTAHGDVPMAVAAVKQG